MLRVVVKDLFGIKSYFTFFMVTLEVEANQIQRLECGILFKEFKLRFELFVHRKCSGIDLTSIAVLLRFSYPVSNSSHFSFFAGPHQTIDDGQFGTHSKLDKRPKP